MNTHKGTFQKTHSMLVGGDEMFSLSYVPNRLMGTQTKIGVYKSNDQHFSRMLKHVVYCSKCYFSLFSVTAFSSFLLYTPIEAYF